MPYCQVDVGNTRVALPHARRAPHLHRDLHFLWLLELLIVEDNLLRHPLCVKDPLLHHILIHGGHYPIDRKVDHDIVKLVAHQ